MTKETKPRQSGDIAMSGGHMFRWMIQGDRTPEIYGWVEKDHQIVPKSGGFWRTVDPDQAARLAASNFDLTIL